ncbi:DivIVA domain-containing protein [Kineosporia sp. NBRC 101731]|uniref:DivIVA domain-containing protein n=1 Tax=Kineosporia sp. NBRC 101731 TaxID=3032199 RepID=UPI0025533420|nr:DivIVA domain-containing protein [Kineosporia sp. NBRC 101731]
MAKRFPVVARGFDTRQVDELFDRVEEAIAGGDAAAKAAVRQELSGTVFEFAAKGYSPTDVAMGVDQRLSALS